MFLAFRVSVDQTQAFMRARQILPTELHIQAWNIILFGFMSLRNSSEIFLSSKLSHREPFKMIKGSDNYTICWACLPLFNLCTFVTCLFLFQPKRVSFACGVCSEYSEQLLWNSLWPSIYSFVFNSCRFLPDRIVSSNLGIQEDHSSRKSVYDLSSVDATSQHSSGAQSAVSSRSSSSKGKKGKKEKIECK